MKYHDESDRDHATSFDVFFRDKKVDSNTPLQTDEPISKQIESHDVVGSIIKKDKKRKKSKAHKRDAGVQMGELDGVI